MINDLLAFLNRGHARSIRAKKNILASFLLKGISIGISLLLVPLTLEYLNPTKYGIWITISYVVTWFNIFDIGLGHGMRNKFAEAIAKGEETLAKKYVSTTYALLTIVISSVFLLFLAFYPFVSWGKLLNAPNYLSNEVSQAILAVFSLFAIQFVFKLIGVILLATQRPALNNLINTAGSFLSLIGLLLLMNTTNSSLLFAALLFGSTTLVMLIMASVWFFAKEYKQYAPSFKAIDFGLTRNLMGLGGQFFIIQIAAIVVFSTDHIIISNLFSPDQVPPYHIAFKYFNVWVVAFSIIATPMWSAYTEAYTKNEVGWVRNTNKRLLQAWGIFTLVIVIMLLVSAPVYELWIQNKVAIPFMVSAFMALYAITSCFNQTYATFINATGKVRLQFYLSIGAAVVNIPLSIFFAKNLQLGIAGVMLATVVTMLPDSVLMPIQFHKLLNKTAKSIWNK